MKKKLSPRVLVAPLDWGLGHTTRCIPLIRALLQTGCTVYVACNNVAKQLLQQEFTSIRFLPLNGYNIRYASTKRKFTWKILQQIPKIIIAIRKERNWLAKTITDLQIDIVFSDNRYGLSHKKVPCIFITHQLSIQAPYRWLEKIIQKINYRSINRFTECWVPDYAGQINIAGVLSHPEKLPAVPVTYISPLARFSKQADVPFLYKWLIVLSGPEPQRTLLESNMLQAISSMQEKVLFIRGLPESTTLPRVPEHCTIMNHLPTTELQKVFEQSEYIISRSGYTTVMEILAMQKKSVLLPTPGQTEQEYLARHLMQQHWCYSFQQHEDIIQQLQLAQSFSYTLPQLPSTSLQKTVSDTIKKYS